MFELYLPYLIGMAIGITPPGAGAPSAEMDAPTVATQAMTPEDQTPTGQFTTAGEVKPILGMTKGNWVAVRNYEGQDLLYFTHLMSWRCGLFEVRYGLNGAAPTQILPMEPCHLDTNAPNSMTQVADFLPYVTLQENSVDSVTVEVLYDDATSEVASFTRSEIQIP